MTSPKIIFEGVDWVKQEGETLGLQSGLLTDAWTGAYIYFGAHWKQEDSFQDYLAPPGKTKAKPTLKPHSFFDAGQAMKHTQEKAAHNLYEDPIELSDDDAMEEPTAKTADEESPPTAKGPATPATPGNFLHSPSSFTSARRGTRLIHSFNKKEVERIAQVQLLPQDSYGETQV
jgi:hypothetical protein